MARQASTVRANRNHKMELADFVLFGYPGRMPIGERIKARREELDMSQTELGEAVGVKQNTVSKWERDESEPSRSQALLLAQKLKLDIRVLELGDNAQDLRTFVIMGYVGAGQAVLPLEDNAQIGEIKAPSWIPADAGVIVVRGKSMRPLYQDGNVLFFWRWTPDPTPYLHREPMVCRLADGGMVVKVVTPGTPGTGLWTLTSLNEDPMLDVKLHSVAPIEVSFRSAHWDA